MEDNDYETTDIQKIMGAVLVSATVLAAAPAAGVDNSVEAQAASAKTLYRNYIKSNKGYKKGALIYVDGDSTPELAVTNSADGISLFTISGGKVKQVRFGYFDSYWNSYTKKAAKKKKISTKPVFRYVKKKNVYYTQDLTNEEELVGYFTWGRISKGNEKVRARGEIHTGGTFDFNGKTTDALYIWGSNGKAVSSKKFWNNYDKQMKGRGWTTPKFESLKKLGLK